MTYATPIKLAAAAAVASAFSFSAPAPSHAQEWNMCDWQEIPTSVLERISNRADFANILTRMFDSCPASALALTEAPTASLDDDGIDERDDAGDRINSEDPNTPEGDDPSNETTEEETSPEPPQLPG